MSATQQMTRRPFSPEVLTTLRRNIATARAAQLEKRRQESDPADHPYPEGETVHATFEDVADWAERNGVQFADWSDLPRINEIRARRVFPVLLPFERFWPVKGKRG
jgi:hypothetical protein